MLHHISLSVSDIGLSSTFYDAILQPLGYVRVWSFPDAVGYGWDGADDQFALKKRTDDVATPSPGFHLAFKAPSREAVDSFHVAAMQAGAADNGAPGIRKEYGAHYYAAFVKDLDGYEIEAVTLDP